jgi:hypothetical protein
VPIALAPKDILAIRDIGMSGSQQCFLEELNWDVVVLHLLLGMPTDRDIPELDDVSVEVVHALGRSDEVPIKATIRATVAEMSGTN